MATTASGAIGLNEIHVQVGEGSSGAMVGIGEGDIRPRMGYGSQPVGFANFYKSWGATITHGTNTVPADKYSPASTYNGFSAHNVIFSSDEMGSLSDESINPSAVSGQTIWADQIFSSSYYQFNTFVLHDGTAALGGSPTAEFNINPGATDPFRGGLASRLCWNDTQRTILSSPVPTDGYIYWQNLALPSSGSYDFACKWS